MESRNCKALLQLRFKKVSWQQLKIEIAAISFWNFLNFIIIIFDVFFVVVFGRVNFNDVVIIIGVGISVFWLFRAEIIKNGTLKNYFRREFAE